jgi:hypothetical protein
MEGMEGIEMDVRLETFRCHRGVRTIDAACGRDGALQMVFSRSRETICSTNSGVCEE